MYRKWKSFVCLQLVKYPHRINFKGALEGDSVDKVPPTQAQGPEFASPGLIHMPYVAACVVAPGFVDGKIPEAPQTLCIARSLNSVFSDRCCVKNKMEISFSTYPQYTYLYMYPLCRYAFTYLNMIIHYTQEKTLRFTRTHYSVCVSHTHAHIHAHILTYNHKYTHSHSHTFIHTHTHRQ